jgi:hypothetical protein
METTYKCKENDVIIKVIEHDNTIDELQFQVEGDKKCGWVVVGYKDLLTAIKDHTEGKSLLKQAHFNLTRKRGKNEYAPDVHELNEEIKSIMEKL